uniref:G-protein coupled receptors family 2 profile 2 domain-containing protein n=1 Tax=Hyaloperonospora arabidopsidis (strain Emoy2) TaxID=559515 RepID=M4C5H0_HYAAE
MVSRDKRDSSGLRVSEREPMDTSASETSAVPHKRYSKPRRPHVPPPPPPSFAQFGQIDSKVETSGRQMPGSELPYHVRTDGVINSNELFPSGMSEAGAGYSSMKTPVEMKDYAASTKRVRSVDESSEDSIDNGSYVTDKIQGGLNEGIGWFHAKIKVENTIHWANNYKIQCCMFFIFICGAALTVAFADNDANASVGLVAGSLITLFCCSAVVYTFLTRPTWRKHPNPIIFFRSICDICLVAVLLITELYKCGSGDCSNSLTGASCTATAALTQFFLWTSESWFFVMAIDMLSSLQSPFTDYKSNVRRYHGFVWATGLLTCLLLVSIPDFAGESEFGYCWTASKSKLRRGKSESSGSSDTSNLWNLNFQSWLLFYIWLILFWIYAITRLNSGLSETLRMRLRVLHSVTIYVIAIIIYWGLSFCIYVPFLVQGNERSSRVEHMMNFMITCKGYFDFVVWFQMNDFHDALKKGKGKKTDVDVDVDLSPQVNLALRCEVLYYTTTGIIQAVRDTQHLPPGANQQELYLQPQGTEDNRGSLGVDEYMIRTRPKAALGKGTLFIDYCPHTFQTIREHFGINTNQLVLYFPFVAGKSQLSRFQYRLSLQKKITRHQKRPSHYHHPHHLRSRLKSLMATRHDSFNRRRPVCNAILKWQLQQEEKRVAEAHYRLMRMSTPSPSSSLRVRGSSSFVRRLGAGKPRAEAPYHLELNAEVTTLCIEPEEHERAMDDARDCFFESELPSQSQVRHSPMDLTSIHAAQEFYSTGKGHHVRPCDDRTNAILSDVEVPIVKRVMGRKGTGSSSNKLLNVDGETRIANRWRVAARMGTPNTVEYDIKEARANVDQLSEPPPGRTMYSTNSSFVDLFSCRNSTSYGTAISCHENGEQRSQSRVNGAMNGNVMAPNELSTERAKFSARQHSEVIVPGAGTKRAAVPAGRQSIAEILASLENTSTGTEALDGDVADRDDQNCDGSADGHRTQLSCGDVSSGDAPLSQTEVFSGVHFPRWSLIVVACCCVIGISGFLTEELLVILMLLFSKRIHSSPSRFDHKRMRDRADALQQELRGFQLSIATIETKSQAVLTGLRLLISRMRQDRERHQQMLVNGMQEFRHHISHTAHEIVDRERERIHARLIEVVAPQVSDDEGVDGQNVIAAAADVYSDLCVDEGTTGEPVQVIAIDGYPDKEKHSLPVKNHKISGEQFRLKPAKAKPSHELVPRNEVAVSATEVSVCDHAQDHAGQNVVENELVRVREVSKVMSEGPIPVPESEINDMLPSPIQEVITQRVQGAKPAVLPVSDQDLIKIDVVVAPIPDHIEAARYASGKPWDVIFMAVGITVLSACFALRSYNINRRKRWLEERRKRRSQRALRLARQRARAMAARQDDSDEWNGDDTDGMEEVSLMAHTRDIEFDESRASDIER